MFLSTLMYALWSPLDAGALRVKVSAALRLDLYPPHDNYGALTHARLEILLLKEADQRSGDDIYPRIDRQLLGGGILFGRYETLRHILVEFILTVCR